ncbi:MAG: hypothetical protein M3P93_13995, partial [Actinomycetota bacterium]|nr:hypothetical protein [Actinomycetota bacterium]
MHPDQRARCAACAALVRPGAPWCTQCYADLRDDPAGAGPVEGDPDDLAPVRVDLAPAGQEEPIAPAVR